MCCCAEPMELECGIKVAGVEAVAAGATADWMDQISSDPVGVKRKAARRNCGVIGIWSVP